LPHGFFTFRLLTAPTKRWYLLHGGGTFDLLGCVPGLRIFRLLRIVRAIRIVRRLGGPRVFWELRAGLASGTLYLVICEIHPEEDVPLDLDGSELAPEEAARYFKASELESK
jgi:hypothetical protein